MSFFLKYLDHIYRYGVQALACKYGVQALACQDRHWRFRTIGCSRRVLLPWKIASVNLEYQDVIGWDWDLVRLTRFFQAKA